MKGPTKIKTRRKLKPFVVRGGVGGRMFLGGIRHDGGPWWRLWPKDARRYASIEDAERAAAWSDGTVEHRG